MSNEFRPVYLDTDRCNGCVGCMKRCPTEAIRVRGGKAQIMYDPDLRSDGNAGRQGSGKECGS